MVVGFDHKTGSPSRSDDIWSLPPYRNTTSTLKVLFIKSGFRIQFSTIDSQKLDPLVPLMHMNDLPREIIEAIFDIHVYIFQRSRHPLLLVCRHWYSIATTYRTLWRSIAFGHQVSVEPATILCPDLPSLALVLSRTGTATYDFYLGAPFFELDEEDIQSFMSRVEGDWLSRCRYLMVFPSTGQACSSAELGALFLSCNFEALECLEIRHEEGDETWEPLLGTIVERIESSAYKIRALKIRVEGSLDSNTSWITQSLFHSTNIASCISSLQLRGIFEPVPWVNFYNIEKLELWTHSRMWPAITFELPPVPHLTLGNTDVLNSLSSSRLWMFLTHLTFKEIDDDLTNVIHLPVLTRLSVAQCNIDLRYIDAPKLRELEIRFYPFNYIRCSYPALEHATITPQILNIDIQNTDLSDHLLSLVAPSTVWLQAEEIQVRVRGVHQLLPSLILDAFSGVRPRRFYPKLRTVIVLYPLRPETAHPGAQIKEIQIKEMTRIVKSRIFHGEMQIGRLELGWYMEYGDDYVDRAWRVVEWTDCLRKE